MWRVDGVSGLPRSGPSDYLQPSLGSVSDVHDYPRNENRGEKVKINLFLKKFSAADDRRLAADKKRGLSASSLRRHLQRIVGKTMDCFPV